MVHCFVKVSEEEIVAINEAAFFYPSDLVNTFKQLSPSGSVKSVRYIPRRFVSRYNISTTFHLPFRGIVKYDCRKVIGIPSGSKLIKKLLLSF